MTNFVPKRVYIAGKVTGLDIKEYTKNFADAVEFAKKYFDAEVVNPILLGGEQYTWQENMKFCIAELMNCDTVVFIPGWESSSGANLEYKIAKALGYNLAEFETSLVSQGFSDIHEID